MPMTHAVSAVGDGVRKHRVPEPGEEGLRRNAPQEGGLYSRKGQVLPVLRLRCSVREQKRQCVCTAVNCGRLAST